MGQEFSIVGNLLLKVDGAEAGLNKLKNSLNQLKMPANLDSNLKKSFSNLDGLFAKYKAQLKDGFNTKADVSNFTKTGKQIEVEYDRISATITKLTGKEISFKTDLTAIHNVEKELEKLVAQKEKLISDTKSGLGLTDLLENIRKFSGGSRTHAYNKSNILETSLGRGDLQKAKEDVKELINALENMSAKKRDALETKTGMSMAEIINKIKNSVDNADASLRQYNTDIKASSDAAANLKSDQFDRANKAIIDAAGGAERLTSDFKQLNGTAQETANSMFSMTKQVEQLQQSTQYFFSLRNMINLFKRGIDDAVQSVKELDKAMTDTAVVTDYNISDLWGMLPEYTKIANELGATTQGAYETMTLYFQQGLDQQQAFEIGAETMKMARIAGLDYAEATDMMTAALRGFNMELNDVSAQRVNDVYSKIAAVTASDTEELGTAMQRTASIAHSAGMSFEGTTAFLAQAIETTREPAENLGTAMKTIIARFQELKKNPLEISEVEGEEVNYNKIDAALKTIGVDLKDTNGQFRDLDKVFLDISQRWDSLSQTQQRYIATTAAGSRQQSRFIAMMSNYSRTVELMDAANNSAGASEEQFGKTMESLEAKLNKLHNAWQQFTMGIANNSMIKAAVDGVTGFLTVINTLIDKLSFGVGPVKSLLSLLMAFTGLKAAGRIANSMIGGLGGLLDPQSSFFKGFKGGFVKNTDSNAQASAISNPIVNAIHQLQAALTGKAVVNDKTTNPSASYEAFKKANNDLRGYLSNEGKTSFRVADAYGKISGLDNRQQASILGQLPGLTLSLKKNGIEFDTKDLSKGSAKLIDSFKDEINQGLKDNTVTPQNAMQIFGTPAGFKKAMEARGPEYAEAAQEAFGDVFGKQFSFKELFDQSKQELLSSEDYNFLELDEIDKIATTQAQQAYDKQAAALENFNNRAKVTQSAGAEIANSFGKVGSYAMMAGQGVAQLGMQLSNAGFETAGAAVTNLGYKISSLGQIASSVGGIVGKITDLGKGSFFGGIKAAAIAHPYIAAAVGIVAAISTIAAIAKVHEKKIKDAAEKVTKNYEDTINGATEKISKLNSAKDIFNDLSRGVDEFGNNVSLTQEEYDQYLQTSQEIAQVAPELIRGYDAQGRAIIATGDAIDQLIAKQEELKASAVDTFITNSSIDDIVGGIRISDAYKKYGQKNIRGDQFGQFSSQLGVINRALVKAGVDNFDEITQQLFGKEINLLQPSDEDIRLLSEHYGDIYRLIESQNSNLTDKQKEGLQDAFVSLGEGWDAMLDELQPLSQAIGQYLSSEGLDTIGLNLGEEFTESFNKGLESLTMTAAMEGWDASKIKQEARDYAEGFKEMTQEGSEYATIMEQVTAEQEKFDDVIGETGAVDNYKNAVEEYAVQLENLADKYDDGTAAGQLFANTLREQANSVRNYATESVLTLGQALNTLSDEFASARGAKDRFEEATKGGDYYTAAEGYKSIIDTVLDEKNKAGGGSLIGWAGAEELLGVDYVDSHSWDQIVSQINKVKGCFEDGADGVLAFNNLLVENKDQLEGLGHVAEDGGWIFDLQNEDLAEYAKTLNMSEEALAALIDKARQWVPIDLGDPGKIRQALEAADYSMSGTSSKGESLLYTSESEFRSEAKRQGIVGENYSQTKADAYDKGVRFLTVENLTAKNQKDGGAYLNKVLDNIGLKGADKTLDNAVAALTKMGFSLEEQQQILSSDGIKLADGPVDIDQVTESYNEQAYALENPTVAGIASDTGIIASAATAMLTSMGILTEEAKQDIDEKTSEDYVRNKLSSIQDENGDAIKFTNSKERSQARQEAKNLLSDYNDTLNILNQARTNMIAANAEADTSEIDSRIEAIEERKKLISDALADEETLWQESTNKVLEGFENFDSLAGSDADKQFLQDHAVEVGNLFASGDATAFTSQLKQLREEGDLSEQSVLNLVNAFSQLTGINTTPLLTQLGYTGQEIAALRHETEQPFQLNVSYDTQDLVNYADQIDDLTEEERNIIIHTNIPDSKKVYELFNAISDEFAGDDVEKKEILIQATAKLANGDTEGAHDLIQDAFGDQTEDVEAKLNILCEGKIGNKDAVKQALQTELVDISSDISIDADFNVGANTDGGTLNIHAAVETAEIDAAKNSAKEGAEMPIDADTSKADTKIANLKNIGSATLVVNATKGTGWTFTANVIEKARGQNYSIPAHQSISFGSAADGMNVPKPKKSHGTQMTALVGEEGFEVGYIPSEQRSVIFGANGPEMTTFPKDTIIYPHDKSKEILRRGKGSHINAGSYQGGLDSVKSSKSLLAALDITSGPTGNTATTETLKAAKTTQGAANTLQGAADDVEEVTVKTGKIVVWWDNQTRKVEKTIRLADRNQKKFDKVLDRIIATVEQAEKKATAAISKYLQSIGYNEESKKRAKKELRKLDKGTKSKTLVENGGSWAEISYEGTKKNNKGETIKETKTATIDLSDYIKFDKESKTYQVDQDAIDAVSKKNLSKRKAVSDAAEKAINDLTKKLETAEDNIESANEAIRQIGQDIYDTFYGWENTLTRIYKITQLIETVEGRIAAVKGGQDLVQAQLASGLKSLGDVQKQYVSFIKGSINGTIQEISLGSEAIAASQAEVKKVTTKGTKKSDDYQLAKSLKAELDADEEYENKKEAAKKKKSKLKTDKDALAAAKEEAKNAKTKKQKKKAQQKVSHLEDIVEKDREAYNKAKAAVPKSSANLSDEEKELKEAERNAALAQYKAAKKARTYVKTSKNADGTVSVNFDVNKLENDRKAGLITEAEFEEITNYVEDIQEANNNLLDEYNNQASRLTSLYQTVADLKQERAEQAKELFSQYVDNQKQSVENTKTLSNAISDAFKDLVDTVKTKLDERRKQEDNKKTEKDISKKQQRLAILQADTAGGHQLEIAQLQQEIADAQQSYGRTLEDQMLNTLSQQNDEAQKQRERQIALAEAQVEINTLNGTYASHIDELLAAATNPETRTAANQEIADLLKQSLGYDGLPQAVKDVTDAEIEQKTLSIDTYQEQMDLLGSAVEATKSNLEELQTALGNVAKELGEEVTGADPVPPTTPKTTTTATEPKKSGTGGSGSTSGFQKKSKKKAKETFPYGKISAVSSTLQNGSRGKSVKALQYALQKLGYLNKSVPIDGIFGPKTLAAVKKFQKAVGVTQDGIVGPKTKKKFKAKGYVTGGIADYTGPAWLHGTPSKPELVLNATDTQNFLALKDVLANVMKAVDSNENITYGNATYEININVDHLNNDYDVDKVAEKVKKIIVKDSSYRNVTQVRNFR